MSHEKIASTFDEWADNGRGERMENGHGDVVEQVIEQLNIKAGYQVLDLGCGIGWATRILAQASAGVQAIGVDASPAMIKKAEELSSLRIRARYEVGSFEALDFKDGKFDLVFSMEALYYAPDLSRSLAELSRVLTSGGGLEIVIDYYSERPGTESWAEYVGLELHRHSEAEWLAAVEAAGFVKASCSRVIDRRGPGEEADFQATQAFDDWDAYKAYCEAGSLWIRAENA